jgi:hypothetical protein
LGGGCGRFPPFHSLFQITERASMKTVFLEGKVELASMDGTDALPARGDVIEIAEHRYMVKENILVIPAGGQPYVRVVVYKAAVTRVGAT